MPIERIVPRPSEYLQLEVDRERRARVADALNRDQFKEDHTKAREDAIIATIGTREDVLAALTDRFSKRSIFMHRTETTPLVVEAALDAGRIYDVATPEGRNNYLNLGFVDVVLGDARLLRKLKAKEPALFNKLLAETRQKRLDESTALKAVLRPAGGGFAVRHGRFPFSGG